MPDIRCLISVSRPRFWLYVFGPYIVGLAAGIGNAAELLTTPTAIFAIYFLLPANLLIYGVNDIFDYETDRLNPKKNEYELLVQPSSHRKLWAWIALLNVPFIIAAILLVPHAAVSLAGFLFFSFFYSAPPIRAKAKPVIDSVFNILYVFPGAFAFQMITGAFPPLTLFIAAGLWTMAMHAYSAIPDIDADEEAGIATVATLLGRSGTLIFCLVMYLGSAALAFSYLGYFSVAFGGLYAAMIAISFASKNPDGIFGIYRNFPLVNAVAGFFLFWLAAWPKVF
ncbi:MAG: prenyltransferase [Pyrinomonadaceae bacterium]|nr:prenyltransferase [Pyrinomonadaceae bacterium]